MTPKKIPFNYDINRMEAVDLVSIIHIDDYDTRFLELFLSNEGSPLNVDGCTVTARFVTAREKYLLRDDVSCEAVENTITIPIDAAAVDNMACDIKIEVNIVEGEKVLTLPFPLWIRVRGSILDDAQITPESEGTIPDLLKAAQQALDAATAAIEAASDYENMENKPQINGVELIGNKTSAQFGLQKELTAGENVTISENGVISATGGTNDYNDLTNKPTINYESLVGNKRAVLKIYDSGVYKEYPFVGSKYWLADKEYFFVEEIDSRIQIKPSYKILRADTGAKGAHNLSDINNLPKNLLVEVTASSRISGMPFFTVGDILTLAATDGNNRAQLIINHSDGDLYYRRFNINDTGANCINLCRGSQIVSGVVNQNGTITFTDFDGNTFTTTGASVIGEDGFSPIATVTQTQSGATVSITDKNGTTTANISNGADGQDYVLTNQDKTDIANIVLQLLPTTQGVLYGNAGN